MTRSAPTGPASCSHSASPRSRTTALSRSTATQDRRDLPESRAARRSLSRPHPSCRRRRGSALGPRGVSAPRSWSRPSTPWAPGCRAAGVRNLAYADTRQAHRTFRCMCGAALSSESQEALNRKSNCCVLGPALDDRDVPAIELSHHHVV